MHHSTLQAIDIHHAPQTTSLALSNTLTISVDIVYLYSLVQIMACCTIHIYHVAIIIRI